MEGLGFSWDNRCKLDDRAITLPEYGTECRSAEIFDITVGTKFFTVYKEVCGRTLQPKFHGDIASYRIDRVLVPKAAAVDAGWSGGIIGVEIKASDKKGGPAICQAMDYMRSVFYLPSSGFSVTLEACFIWPLGKPAADIACVMAQHRVGVVCRGWREQAEFMLGDQKAMFLSPETIDVGSMDYYSIVGRKQGSR